MKAGAKDVWNGASPGTVNATRETTPRTWTGHHPKDSTRRQNRIGMHGLAAALRMTFLGYVIVGRWTGLAVTVAQALREETWLQRPMWARCQTVMMAKAGEIARCWYLGQDVPRRSLA